MQQLFKEAGSSTDIQLVTDSERRVNIQYQDKGLIRAELNEFLAANDKQMVEHSELCQPEDLRLWIASIIEQSFDEVDDSRNCELRFRKEEKEAMMVIDLTPKAYLRFMRKPDRDRQFLPLTSKDDASTTFYVSIPLEACFNCKRWMCKDKCGHPWRCNTCSQPNGKKGCSHRPYCGNFGWKGHSPWNYLCEVRKKLEF